MAVILSGVLPFVHAQLTSSEYTVRTVYVFPDKVQSEGWQNIETISFQNLDEYALLQEFNAINSATMEIDVAKEIQKEQVERSMLGEIQTEITPTEPEPEEPALSTTTGETNEQPVEEIVEETSAIDFGLPTTTETEVLEELPVSEGQTTTTEETTVPQEPIEEEVFVAPEEPTDPATTTVMNRVTSFFTLAVSSVTSLFDSPSTSPEEIVDETLPEETTQESDEVTEEIPNPEPLAENSTTTDNTEPEILTGPEVITEPEATTTDEVIPTEVPTSSEETTDTSIVTEEDTPVEAPVVEEVASTTPIEECVEDCTEHKISLSSFGYPLDAGIEISGAQLRLSFAAQKKEYKEHIPTFSVRYTLDQGETWTQAGTIMIEDEVSNSINGGYFLYAIPELTDQASFDALEVELLYNDDLDAIEGLFVESVWLELFTLEATEIETPVSFLDVLDDDGYDEVPLFGDELELPDGELVEIASTDDNSDETLIIKSDQESYQGFSEATTYFSVTNTSNDVDEFTIQTYFPDGVGQVKSLEVYNQNKPRSIKIPEYRPFVYNCEAGWEYAGEYDPSEHGDVLELFAEPIDGTDLSQEEILELIGTSTPEVQFTVPTTSATDTAPIDLEEENTNTTTTVFNTLPNVAELLQFTTTESSTTSTTTNEAAEEISEEVIEADETELATTTEALTDGEEGEDVIAAYACRNTNIVRPCDSIEGDNTACHITDVKIKDHEVTKYAPGWDEVTYTEGEMAKPGLLKRMAEFIGFGPDRKDVPEEFEVRAHTDVTYEIQPGETVYFKMEISFPPFSSGEYWIEAIGDSEYGLLDPFWSSQWTYRIPIAVTNPTGVDQTEYQVFFEIDNTLSDFWSNVNSDGSDIRFIQEVTSGTFSNEDTAINNWVDFDFSHRIPIIVPAGTVDQDLSSFPVSVNLTNLDSTFWANVKSDGGDIRIYNTSGTELAIDLAEFDGTADTGELHFLADVLVANGANTFYLYFGDATLSGYAATAPLGSEAVWTGANYNAVYHFSDDPTTIGNTITDETGTGHDLTVNSVALATTTGQLGSAIDFTPGAGWLASSTWNFPGGFPLNVTGSYFMSAANGEALYQWGTGAQPNIIRFEPWYGGDDGRFTFGNTTGDEYVNRIWYATTTWHGFGTIGTTSTSDNNYVYEDGVLVETLAQTFANASNTTGGGFQMGRDGGGGNWLGYVDELRIATTTRPVAWVKAETVNLQSPEKFYVAETTQEPTNAATLNWYSTSWEQRIKISIPSGRLQEDLTDFPILVDLANLGASFFSGVASDGRDIRITEGDGVTELPLEIVSISTGSKTGEMYFKADLSDSAANDFYIYFNNSDVSAYGDNDTYGAHNVWTNDFRAVYHFEEDQAGTGNVDLYTDSTSNEYHGDDETTSNDNNGYIGGGLELGDATSDYVSLPPDVLNGVTDISVSGFYKVPASAANDERTILSAANSIEDDEFRLQLEFDGSGDDEFFFTHSNGTESTLYDNGQNWGDDEWDHFTVVGFDVADQVDFYLNGVADGENVSSPQAIDAISVDTGGLVLGQEQTAVGSFDATNYFVGLLDEIRISSTTRTEGWAVATHDNLVNQSSFVATSSSETLQPTGFVELDFWVQYFDDTAEETDIWVQIEDFPAGEETIIYLYYGNTGASSASDEIATFSYSTSTDIFYVVDDHGASSIRIQSLVDNNIVSIDGDSVSLDQGESTTTAAFTGDTVISILGPISGTITGAGNDGSDMLAPIGFATTSFAIPTSRSVDQWFVYAPFASTTARIYEGSSGTSLSTANIATSTAHTFNVDITNTNQGVDGDGAVVEATSPVLLTHRHTTQGDGLVSYPPTMRDIFGLNNQYMHFSALASNSDPLLSCSAGAGGTLTGITRGDQEADASCTAGSEGTGAAVRASGQANPITALSQADADGNESTVYWPQIEFGTRYAMTNDAAYAAVVCSPRFGTTTLEVQDSTGNTISSGSCTPGATTPGKAYFGAADAVTYTAGHQVVSTDGVPFMVTYEDVTVDQDEKNVSGPVQARKFGGEYATFTYLPQEMANDTDWEQLSFWWYQNADALTPTSTWMLGSEGTTEGDSITGAGAVDDNDVLRLRINLEGTNATATKDTNAFTLQYTDAVADQCDTATTWYDLGEQGSTTAVFSGYNNTGVNDGATLSTTTLASSTVLGTYEERNYSDFLPSDVNVGEVVEYDWVIEATNIAVNTNYCFRMVRAQGGELETYTLYPQLETVGPPNTPTLLVFFDNERTTVLTPVLEFTATDNAGDEINYRVQVDNDYDFSSVVIDRNSDDHFTQFENLNDGSDKSPFTSGQRIRFTASTALSATTTYYWRVQADDPAGSATTSAWSTPFSFTTDTVITTSEWFQTTDEQFSTNALSGVATGSDQVSVSSSPGTMTSGSIDFDDGTIGNAWGELDWNDTETAGEITYQVEYDVGGSWALVPDSLIPGNSVGTTTGPISLLALDTSTYNEIRLVATFTGTTLTLQDWVVKWGQRVETPTQGDPFDNQKVPTTTPVFDFVSSDPQGDDLEYEISFSTDIDFLTSSTTYNSSTSAQFANSEDGGDTSPFTTDEVIEFTTPGGSPFVNGTTYWWRTRARDPNGDNAWSPWSNPDAFTIDTAVTKSTWFQTTEEQFDQGILDGVIASTSDSVELTDVIGEYGTVSLTNNGWQKINTTNTYNNMVVVASPEYDGSVWGNNRNARVRNKTENSFEIKVDDFTNAFSGTTQVDYMVMEAGTWTFDEGGTGVQVIAGTAYVTAVQARPFQSNIGTEIDYSATPFSSAPVGIATVSTNNDSDWIGTHMDGNGADHVVEITTTQAQFALNASYDGITTHGAEDIDYVIMGVADGTVNGGDFEAFNSADQVDDVQSNGGYTQSFQTGFGSTPQVTLVQNNAEDGGDGGFGIRDTSGTTNSSQIFLSLMEGGAGANGHTQEIVSIIAFEGSSGIIKRLNTGDLSGTIAGEDIIFSDGVGPKFDNFSWNDTTPGTSTVNIQMEYEVSEGVYALIPDSQIPNNSVGTTSGLIDLTSVDINIYSTIRAFATLQCASGNCPTLDDWTLEWSEGVSMSGTLQEYDRLTNVATGTVRAAVNGTPVGGSATVSAGTWTLNNVTAFDGDIVTVWVDGAAESEEAVGAFVYDGLGDITGVELFEQHLSISADENGTTTNALLGLYDNLASSDEDIFFDVDASNNLVVCSVGTCSEANIYVGPGNIYIPNAAGGVSVDAHDFVSDGFTELDSNTFNISGSWDNNATSTTDTSTINMTAATGTESISSPENPLNFHNLSFGSGAGNATFTIPYALDLSGNLTVASGTLSRDEIEINLAGNLTTGTGGFWLGTATTTFDGSGAKTWRDDNAVTQMVGDVVIDGASTNVTAQTDVGAYDVRIGGNDLLNGSNGNTIYVGGDWENNGTFNAQSGTVEIVVDDRTYPPIVPGSADWYYDANFEDRIGIVVDNDEVPGNLTDFPIYVDLSLLGSDFWNDVKSDGSDIRVTSGDGQTELPIDLVEFDSTAKTGELHFLASSVSGSATTTFYIYHNNATATAYAVTDTYGRNAVWTNYEAVYHFSDDPTSVDNILVDSSGKGKDLIVVTEALSTSSGQLGTAVDLSGSTGILTDGDWAWTAGDRLESSGWYKMGAASSEALWAWSTATTFNFMPWYSGNNGYHRFGSADGAFTFTFAPRDAVNWNHFTTQGATSTSETVNTYIDTILRDNPTQLAANPSASGLQIGRYGGGGSWEGEIDELRFATSSRNTDWITAEYNNQNAPGVFYSTTSVQTYVPDQVIDEPTHDIDSGGSAFFNIIMNDATTSPAFVEPSVVVNGTFTISTGTVSLPTGILTVGSSFINNGYFMHNNAEVEFISSGAATITLNGTAFYNAFYDVTFDGSGSWSFTDTNATSSNDVVIEDGTVNFPSGVFAIGGTLDVNGGGFNANNGTVLFTSTQNENITTSGSSFNDVIFGLNDNTSGWYDIDWGRRIQIAIASTSVSENVTDFPVYIDLSSLGTQFWNNIQVDGSDIRMTTSNGKTEIAVEVADISAGGQTGELYFLAPSLSSVVDTNFYLYIDNPTAVAPDSDSTYGSEAVWVGYEAVYHFNDDPTVSITDVSGNGKDLAPSVGTPSTTPGLLGTALDTTSASVMVGDSDWTWTAGEDLVSSGLYFQTAADTGALWQFGTTCVADTCISFMPWYSGTTGYNRFGELTGSDYVHARDNSVWHHFTTNGRATDGESVEVFEDTILRDTYSQTAAGQNPTQTGLQLGRYTGGTYMDIDIDELRFATTTRSQGWINTEYNNLTDNSNFFSTSSELYLDVVPSYTLNEANTDADGDVTIYYSNLVSPSNEFTIGGSALNTGGSYDPNNATTTFDSSDTGETVDFGEGAFYNLSFDGAGGGWTISTTTVNNNASLVVGASFTLATNTTMTVGGVFSNTFNSAATTWTDSTLVLTGGDYTVTGRLDSGDNYATMRVSNDSDIVIWNSSISTSTILDTSSLYMPDFNGTDGLLRIYGAYDRSSGSEYWSYNTDFDGTNISGSPRQAVVEMGRGSVIYLATSTTLEANGISGATTTVSAISGIYSLNVNAGTIDLEYVSFDDAGPKGLYLTNGTTVSTLTNSEFAVAGGRSGITVDASTVNAQPSSEYTGMIFGTSSASGIYEPEWNDQVIVTIQSSQVNENLTEFPVYIDLSLLGANFWSGVKSDGGDIRVTTDNGSEVPIDLVEIDTASSTGELHFLASSLSSSMDTVFYIHFNNPSATMYDVDDLYGANNVWKNYEAVYHFNEDPTISITDMSGNGRTLTPAVGSMSTTSGQIGTALDTTAASAMLQNLGWTWTPGDDLISSGLYFMSNFDTGALWEWGSTCGTDDCIAFMPWYNTATIGYHRFGETTANDYNFTRNATIWHHFTTIGRASSGEEVEIYEDNVLRDTYTQTVDGENPSLTGLQIGRYVGGTYMDIDVDELRFSTTSPTANWISAEYTNLTAPATFFSTSSELTYTYNVTTETIPSSFWLFSGGTGNIYGEDYDNDDGDPGSIQWDDSNFAISISGTVYSDDGVTPETYPVCNASTEVVTVVLDGLTTYTAPCDPLDGTFEVTGISYTGEPQITTYLNSEATETQVNVAIFDEATATGTTAGGGFTVTRPSVVDNSVLVVIAGKDDDPAITNPAGWTVVDTLGNTTGDDLYTGIWYRVVADASTEPATYNFTSDNGEGFAYWIGTLVNVDTTTPIDVANTWTKVQNSSEPEASEITTVTNGALVLSAWYTYIDSEVVVPVYEWESRVANLTDTATNNFSVSSKLMETAGGTGSSTLGGVIATRETHTGQFAFRPDSSPTGSSSVIAAAVTKTPLGSAGSSYDTVTLRDQRIGAGTVAASADVDVVRPAVQNGDVLVAILGKEDDFSFTAPSGWVLGDDLLQTVGSQMYTGIWYKVITNAAGEPATYAFTNTDTGTEEYGYWIGSFEGVDTNNVFDVTPNWTNVQNSSSPAAPSVTTVRDGAYVLSTWYVIADGGMFNPGSPWTTLAQDVINNTRLLAVSGRSMTTAGATGDATLTGGSTDDVNVGQFALRPAALSVADSISDMDLYRNRVIVRHEDISPLTIADMVIFDNGDDSDLPFTASVGTPDLLTVLSGSGLAVWNNKTFDSGGEVLLAGKGSSQADGSLLINPSGTFRATTTEDVTIGGSLYLDTGATFDGASSLITFNATGTGQSIGSAASSTITMYDVAFTGVGGGWAVQTPIVSENDILVSTGTVSGVSNITVNDGSLSGNGLVNMSGGTTNIRRDNTLGGTQAWTFNNLTLGGGAVAGVTSPAGTATTTVNGVLTIEAAHFLDAGNSVWDLGGNGNVFVENGTFLEDTSTFRYSGATPNILQTPYYNLVIDTDGGGSVTATAPVTGLQVLNDLTVGVIGTSTLDVDTNDPALSVGEDLLIGTLGTVDASDTQTMTVNGNWDNDGSFFANAGTVTLSNTVGASTVSAGNSSFANLNVLGGATYTFDESATATENMVLNTGNFTLDPNLVLAVGGTFSNNMSGALTTWSTTTLSLYSGTSYEISDKTRSDVYNNIVTADGTHVRLWNSTTSVVTTNGSSSLYSMNHEGANGDLYIFGDYINDGYSDHWSYADDFDGTALGTGRQVDVLIEAGGSVRYPSGSLYVIGTTTASTSIAAQSAGNYQFIIGGDTEVDMNYYVVRDTPSEGLVFTGSPTVLDLSYGDFEVAIADGSTMTVGGNVISVNPAKNFTNIRMATTTAINAYNVTATGTSASAWRFVNVPGNLGGEAKDVDPGGDPGYLTWEDSAAIINISGNVYSDEGVSTSAACDSTTSNVWLSIQGLTFASTTCNGDGLGGGTGAYSFTGISYGLGDTLTVYINDEPENAVTITQDPVSSINGFDLYENRVIIKHESAAAMTIADMEVWDSDDDADILFDAEVTGTDTLVLPSDTKLIVWSGKDFEPGGNVTVSGGGAGAAYDGTLELQANATFVAANGEDHSIGGSLIAGAGAVFTPAQSTTTFTTTGLGRTIDTNESGFYNLILNGTGDWTANDTVLTVANDFTITNGDITLPAATTTIGGSFDNTGGSFDSNSGLLYFTSTAAGNTVEFNGSDATTVLFDGVGGAWTFSDTNATATDSFTVANGGVTLPSGKLAVGENFIVNGTVAHSNGTVELTSIAGGSLITLSGSDLSTLNIDAGTGDYTLTDSSATFLGDLTITSGTFTSGTGTVSIGGSFDATGGTFNHSTGTLLFNSGDTGEFIDPGANDMYNVIISGAGGGWTILDNATTTNNFTMSVGNSFTQSSSTVLYVGGVFTNNIGGSATTWHGSTLFLDSGTEYETNVKSTATERYNVLIIGDNTDVSSWNASATSTTVSSSGSWYSQDHAGVNGDLYIYGDYHIPVTTEYWSRTTDFDGADISGSPRAVSVEIASSSTITLEGGTLNIVGGASATTTINNQGTGLYTFIVSGGTFNADYYSFRNMDSSGLQFTANATVSSLDNGDFEQAGGTTTLITLASTTLNANPGLVITDTRFANGGFANGYNVSLDATSTNSWTFTGAFGNLWGEAFDIDGTDDCSSIRWDDSQCLLTEQSTYRWRNDDGGEGATPGTWYDSNWGQRKRVRVINNDAAAYTNVAVKLDVTYDTDMQTDFDDIRFTDASGTTSIDYWLERFTTGNEADFWVQVPFMATSSVTEIYMYYGNVSATTTSSISNVFNAYDDFEDNNITEYSGDTPLFATAGTFAYGGGYGLDASPNTAAKATDGIGRTDFTISQGEIIRYMQYIDTTAGSADEVCTMFGLQSPVTNNQNYAVCLEQFGPDRMSLVKDVQNTDSTGTQLASTTVTYSTGWYEVEIDWQTDNSIDVSLYNSSGVEVASTSASDSTYTSGGLGFTFWGQNGGWDSYVSWPRTDTKPTAYFGAEQVDGGASWKAAQDTATGGYNVDETARLRIGIENSGLAIENQNFRLEFAPKLAAPSCESVSAASFGQVPVSGSCGTSAICMTNSASTTDGDATTDHLVTDAGPFVAGEIVEDTSNQTTNLDVAQDSYTELEYAIKITSNATNDAYCFRVTDAGSALDSYALLPELTLAFDPQIGTVNLNNGVDISLTPGATTTVLATTTVTDYNGFGDLANATTTFYTTTATVACTADNNDCYIATSTCSFSDCSGNSCTLTCSADFQFHADPTDADGGEFWYAFMEVSDTAGGTDFGTSIGLDVLTLRALDAQNAISYGTLDINQNTGTFNPNVSLSNFGNEAIDVQVSGTDMTDGLTSVIPAAEQLFSTSTFDYPACGSCNNLTATGTDLEVDLAKPTVDDPPVSDSVYWGVAVPFGTASNPHSGMNTFTAIAD